MALKFQYNKTALQNIRRQLTIREKALPTLKNKEAALRLEVRKVNNELDELKENLEKRIASIENYNLFWNEFPSVIKVENVVVNLKNIAGVKVPLLTSINFKIEPISFFNAAAWLGLGIEMFKELMELDIRIDMAERRLELLYYARKKTTQKVNLYEKVQIPSFKSAVIKIKRFMEDEENLSKSAQKIVKERNKEKEAAL